MNRVSLVIPGRNCADTLGPCLDAVLSMRDGALREIIFVDDGSTDDSADIARARDVTVISGTGEGAGAARNLGWRAATGDLVWFVDADCVAEPDALDLLLPHIDDDDVAAVGGSYGNANTTHVLSRLIHEEIVERHLAMSDEVDFLATFNVIYRRSVLETLDGFDERYLKGQDAELAFRTRAAGHRLRFEVGSRVAHYHETRLWSYLRTQRQQGFWRVRLHLEHRGHAAANSYSNALDHLQPPLAMLMLASLPLVVLPIARWTPPALALLLLLAQLPMTWRLVRRTRRLAYVWFAPMSWLRAIWRGVGMTHATIRSVLRDERVVERKGGVT